VEERIGTEQHEIASLWVTDRDKERKRGGEGGRFEKIGGQAAERTEIT